MVRCLLCFGSTFSCGASRLATDNLIGRRFSPIFAAFFLLPEMLIASNHVRDVRFWTAEMALLLVVGSFVYTFIGWIIINGLRKH
jgi:hypothetical protein